MKTRQTKFDELFESLNTDIDLQYHIDINEVESFDDMTEQIENNNGFDIDIIYYYNAMKYLMEHDASLNESMELAHDLGYTADNINSELLASLLATQNTRIEWQGLESEIDAFFEDLEESN